MNSQPEYTFVIEEKKDIKLFEAYLECGHKLVTCENTSEKAIAFIRRNYLYCGDLIESAIILVKNVAGEIIGEVRYNC